VDLGAVLPDVTLECALLFCAVLGVAIVWGRRGRVTSHLPGGDDRSRFDASLIGHIIFFVKSCQNTPIPY
jgi:hypothetical protein